MPVYKVYMKYQATLTAMAVIEAENGHEAENRARIRCNAMTWKCEDRILRPDTITCEVKENS